MTPDLRVALLGFGKGGAMFHAPFIEATPGLRLAAVVTSDPGRREAVHRDHPGAELLDSAAQVWSRVGDFDVAVITTPNDTHAELARAALEAGLAVVVDKPFALEAKEARELVAQAERLGQVLTVYQNRRWDSDFLTVWRLVEEGALGRVHRLESRFERWRPQAKDTWRDAGTAALGGGVLFDLGPHLIDQAVTLFGPVHAVHAELDARREGVAAEDDVFLTLTHDGGVRSHLWMSAIAAQAGPRFRVLGERSAFTVPGPDSQEERLLGGERPDRPDWGAEPEEVWGRLGADGRTEAVPSERGDYSAFWTGLRDAVAEGEPVPVAPHEVIHGLEVVAAARRSAAAGRRVALADQPAPM